jgi:hypothetical protein
VKTEGILPWGNEDNHKKIQLVLPSHIHSITLQIKQGIYAVAVANVKFSSEQTPPQNIYCPLIGFIFTNNSELYQIFVVSV